MVNENWNFNNNDLHGELSEIRDAIYGLGELLLRCDPSQLGDRDMDGIARLMNRTADDLNVVIETVFKKEEAAA